MDLRAPNVPTGRVLSGLLLSLALAACTSSPRHGEADRALSGGASGTPWEALDAEALAERRSRFLVGPEALAHELEKGDGDLVVLEVGVSPEAFREEGRVAGARFLPWKAVAVRREGIPNRIPPMEDMARALAALGVGDDSRIVLYDRAAGLMAGRAWAVLDYVGLGDRTRLLDGQLAGWQAAGGEVETGDLPDPADGTWPTLHPNPDRLVEGDRLADLVWAREAQGPDALPGLHILDARPPAEFLGEEPGDEVERPGHITGARNLPWRTTTGPDDAPFLLETDALLALFREVGVAPGDRVLTYCRTGGQAGHLHFVARMLGLDVRFYDGSFVEWSGIQERPVTRPGG